MTQRDLTKKKIRLLVIDNQQQHFELLKECADVMSDEIDLIMKFASSGKKGLDLIKAWSPSVVLVDVYLPDIGGFDILELCKAGTLPVVITSRNQSDELREAAMDRGATAFVQKSDNPEEIELLMYTLADVSTQCGMKH